VTGRGEVVAAQVAALKAHRRIKLYEPARELLVNRASGRFYSSMGRDSWIALESRAARHRSCDETVRDFGVDLV
jgi:hypothetical protein